MSVKFKMDSIAKLLASISEMKKKEDRIKAIRENAEHNYTFKSILHGMFDPKVKFLLPEGDPPYKENKFDEPKAIYNETSRFYLLVEGGNPSLSKTKREHIFIQMLENVSPDDAKLLIAMKDKKSPYKGITKEIVMAAIPGLIQE